MRIVSLLPSATEIICALGLGEQLVGVTHECDYPAWVQHLPKVTSTVIPHEASSHDIDLLVRERLQHQRALYTLKFEQLVALAPDVLVTQALCDVCAVAEDEVNDAACRLPSAPQVINLEPMSLADVYTTLTIVGDKTGREPAASTLVHELQSRVAAVVSRNRQTLVRPRVAHLEWLNPLFNAGHWTPELIDLAGGIDVLGRRHRPSHSLEWDTVLAAQPEVMTIAVCGFGIERALEDVPSLQMREGWRELPCVKNNRVYVLDGNQYFNRPGPRLVDSLELLAHVLHPTLHPLPAQIVPPFHLQLNQ